MLDGVVEHCTGFSTYVSVVAPRASRFQSASWDGGFRGTGVSTDKVVAACLEVIELDSDDFERGLRVLHLTPNPPIAAYQIQSAAAYGVHPTPNESANLFECVTRLQQMLEHVNHYTKRTPEKVLGPDGGDPMHYS